MAGLSNGAKEAEPAPAATAAGGGAGEEVGGDEESDDEYAEFEKQRLASKEAYAAMRTQLDGVREQMEAHGSVQDQREQILEDGRSSKAASESAASGAEM
jgi:hypothetical protein